MDANLGFVGLGRMGGGMARNLVRAGRTLGVYDVAPGAVRDVVSAGASAPGTIKAVAAAADVVHLCLPDAPQVEAALFDVDGVAAAARDGLLVIDHTTCNRNAALALGERAKAAGIIYCDCPVSGMPFRAQDGTLTIMFGGDPAVFARVEPLLEIMGSFVVHCGELGSGQLMKAINNVIYDINIAAICEVAPLAVKAGLDPQTLARVLTSGSSRSFASEYFVPRMMQAQFDADFPMASAYKDIVNVQEVATELRAPIPLTNAMTAVYQQALTAGFGDEPKSAMLKVYEKALEVVFRGEPPPQK